MRSVIEDRRGGEKLRQNVVQQRPELVQIVLQRGASQQQAQRTADTIQLTHYTYIYTYIYAQHMISGK